MRYKRYSDILLLIAFFRLVFHVSFNSRNTKLGFTGSVKHLGRPSHKLQGNVLCFQDLG